ncbi:MAG: hypothetical protein Q8P22_10355 [Chloroflexota bacterium]|nr:hypothetical protein [Chloroflexota bacterium]
MAQAQPEAERRKETVRADPQHGGKITAMTLSIFESVAPQNAIRLTNKLLAEISFLESESMSPKQIVDRVVSICDADGESG